MAEFKKLIEFTTPYSADSVEWCPFENLRHIFVCGTYHLSDQKSVKNEPDRRVRVGKLLLFALDFKSRCLDYLQSIEMPGILDMKWADVKIYGRILLAIANAIGEVVLYEFKCEDKMQLDYLCFYKLGTDDILSLSLDWSIANKIQIAVSDSKGYITILSVNESHLSENIKLRSHSFEAWITTFNRWNPNVVYTGGDDSKMNVYDVTISTEHPVMKSSAHASGVTSMHCNKNKENCFVSGSYDESIRFWDLRNMKYPTLSMLIGGGVWRLKWEPKEGEDLIAACMYNGFATIKGGSVLAHYKEHSSLAYGVDWCHLEPKELGCFAPNASTSSNLYLISACSFYDCKLTLATYQR